MNKIGFILSMAIGLSVHSTSVSGQTQGTADRRGVVLGGDNNGSISTGDIQVIIQSEAALTDDPSEQQILEWLMSSLTELVDDGEIVVSETAVRKLARNAIRELSLQPLTRNRIEQRQFAVSYQQTYNIAGTNNRITFIRNNCGANFGIMFRFNREEHCWYGSGGSLEFEEDGFRYELVFEGYDSDRNAMFGIYPMD